MVLPEVRYRQWILTFPWMARQNPPQSTPFSARARGMRILARTGGSQRAARTVMRPRQRGQIRTSTANSWPLGPKFALDLKITVPDLLEEGWVWDEHYAPELRSNLAVRGTYRAKTRDTVYRGRFPRFPADILTLRLRWDEKRD